MAQALHLGQVQDLRRWTLIGAIAIAAAALLVVEPFEMGETSYHFWTETTGYVAIVAAIGVRLWCTLYIGSRKNRRLVTAGPYSMTRNPLYVGSFLGAVGVGLQTGMLTFAAIGGAVTALVFALVVEREEAHLAGLFREDYARYCARTPRFLPRLSLYRDDGPTMEFEIAALGRTLRDAAPFLAAILLTEAAEALHMMGWLPNWLTLY
ncbi:isoprenylcysteine carboxylmethyltransferase family protein [Amaricoccus sp.]|uniref:methyltransferase family protein n=1 Tax=Amaricoccus sp. TaxID=1872485 RepID=UPI001B646513|nr:isoprenylcysteine carboxylmethyltransferase family protein [Amaricoccus sp.]MBP7000829.1 isoprenylcysteine carboxylmethyltransferase family protein [Amaricoccus sp.]